MTKVTQMKRKYASCRIQHITVKPNRRLYHHAGEKKKGSSFIYYKCLVS